MCFLSIFYYFRTFRAHKICKFYQKPIVLDVKLKLMIPKSDLRHFRWHWIRFCKDRHEKTVFLGWHNTIAWRKCVFDAVSQRKHILTFWVQHDVKHQLPVTNNTDFNYLFKCIIDDFPYIFFTVMTFYGENGCLIPEKGFLIVSPKLL